MTERSHTPTAVHALRIGRTDLGEGSLTIDEETLTLAARSAVEAIPAKIPLSSVDAVALERADMLAITLDDGTQLTVVTPAAADLREEILLHCRALPELTRALRSLGSRRGSRGIRVSAAADQRRFFAPLIDARRAAVTAMEPALVFAAFDGDVLTSAVQTGVRTFAEERFTEPGPARRALEAELTDAIEPLLAAFQSLGEAATHAAASVDDLRSWRAWTAQLRTTFEVADRVWSALDAALDTLPWNAR